MANGSDKFAVLVDLAHKIDRLLVTADVIGSVTSGDHDAIEISGFSGVIRDVGLDRISKFAGVVLSGNGSNGNDFGTGFTESQKRIPYFEFLVDVVNENGYSFTFEIHNCHFSAVWRVLWSLNGIYVFAV